MKKNLLLISSITIFLTLFFTNNLQAQRKQSFCGFEQVRNEMEQKNPKLKEIRKQAELKLRKRMMTSTMANWTGQIYEVPIVVHIIENRSGAGKIGTQNGQQLTDAEIMKWIDDANKMYSATYSSNVKTFLPAGNGVEQSAIIPFKLVLAKRTPQCTSTTGIVRYDSNNMPSAVRDKYNQHGMNFPGSGGTGAEEADIKTLAPKWDVNTYYNVYVVNTIDDDTSGIMGYATTPETANLDYHSVMVSGVVTAEGDDTLAHELGHAFGLLHTFGDEDSGQNCPDATNDNVADTEIAKCMINKDPQYDPLPTNNDINPCTNQKYQGTQYNVMNYTYESIKFTPGQRTRALALFLQYRQSLTTSKGATPISGNSGVTATACTITGVEYPNINKSFGSIGIKFGTMDFTSVGYADFGSYTKQYYVDYTNQYCYNAKIQTEIPANTLTPMKLTSIADDPQDIRVWIDYNDNGAFENNEMVVDKKNVALYAETTVNIMPIANAVKEKFLRMRVIGDGGNPNIQPCGKLKGGQAQDYLVKIKASNTSTTLTVSLKNITKVYDGNNTATVTANDFTIIGKQGTDDVSLDLTNVTATYDNKNVGTNKTITVNGLALTGADANKYQLQNTSVNGTVGTITKKSVTVTLTGKVTKVYDGNTTATVNANNFNLTGKLGNDTVEVDFANATAAYNDVNVGTNKTVSVTGLKLKGTDVGNYKLQSTSINGAIGEIKPQQKITLTITLKNITKVYDGNNTANVTTNDFTISNIQGSDDVSLDLANITASYDNKNVGTNKTITVNGLALKGTNANKYQLVTTSVNGTVGIITKKSVTVTPDNQSKEYGDADPTLTYTVNPALLNGDSFTGKLTRDVGEDVGNYKITQGSLSVGNNYKINFITGKKIEITKATITGITFDDETFEFDGKEKSLKIKGNLPDGVNVTYTGNDQKKVGVYTVTARLSGANYKDLDLTATLTINRDVLISGEINKALTPNGDGINDFWYIKMLENQPNNKVEIYNRWGQLVFKIENYDNNHKVFKGFGNVSSNEELPQGTYFYRIIANGNMVKQGAVELRR